MITKNPHGAIHLHSWKTLYQIHITLIRILFSRATVILVILNSLRTLSNNIQWLLIKRSHLDRCTKIFGEKNSRPVNMSTRKKTNMWTHLSEDSIPKSNFRIAEIILPAQLTVKFNISTSMKVAMKNHSQLNTHHRESEIYRQEDSLVLQPRSLKPFNQELKSIKWTI